MVHARVQQGVVSLRCSRAGNAAAPGSGACRRSGRGEELWRRGKGKKEFLILEANFGMGRAQGMIAMETELLLPRTNCAGCAYVMLEADHVHADVGIVRIISAPAGAEIYFRKICQLSQHKPHVWAK